MICFRPDIQVNYLDYEVLTMAHPGWSLTEIKAMTHRERKYWLKMFAWKKERNQANG